MSIPLDQHDKEIQENLEAWNRKPLLQTLYAQFYQRILSQLDQSLVGKTVELGSGIGNLKQHLPSAITTDLFPNPWIDQVCSAYELPFADGSLTNLILIDVLHHLERPSAFFKEAKRTLCQHGRIIILDPYISLSSALVYGPLHHEPIGWKDPISESDEAPDDHAYYAAQGNATRMFFKGDDYPMDGLEILERKAFSCWGYFLSGGFSKPSMYPKALLPVWNVIDGMLSLCPPLFAGRCLVTLRKR